MDSTGNTIFSLVNYNVSCPGQQVREGYHVREKRKNLSMVITLVNITGYLLTAKADKLIQLDICMSW
jgi:hypothetical protein